MIHPAECFSVLKQNGIDFFTGVPDSSLKSFTAYIADHTGGESHIIAANEGASIALAVGQYLATGKVPLVYMQNSGLGNAVNPLLSLADEQVYKIPMLIIIGWRGEPGVPDEPQHKKQGEVTLPMLEAMQIPYAIVEGSKPRALDLFRTSIDAARKKSTPHVLIARPSLFETYTPQSVRAPMYELSRELALKIIIDQLRDDDIVVSTTGKLSRELFEYRREKGQKHDKDFLSVGSMGHSSSIALSIALVHKKRRVFCFDGDGAVLMHTGAMSNIGHLAPKNYFHIIFNNGAHESVGGQPTLGFEVDFLNIARAFNYKTEKNAETLQELVTALTDIEKAEGPLLLEVRVKQDSRKDLGRPDILPVDNKIDFMNNLKWSR